MDAEAGFDFERLEERDEGVTVGQAVRAHAIGDAGGQDLLGAAAADSEQNFNRRAVHIGAGMTAELF